jgi:hypothetical protein
MYKDSALRTYQYYVNPDWPGSRVASYLPIFHFSLYFLQEEYMQARVCLVRGMCIVLCWGGKLYLTSFDFVRPGALIAGTWAAMQYLGSE